MSRRAAVRNSLETTLAETNIILSILELKLNIDTIESIQNIDKICGLILLNKWDIYMCKKNHVIECS